MRVFLLTALIALIAAIIASVIAVNLWDRRRRSTLTKEELDAEANAGRVPGDW